MFGEESKKNFAPFAPLAMLSILAGWLVAFALFLAVICVLAIPFLLSASLSLQFFSFVSPLVGAAVAFVVLFFVAEVICAKIYLKSFVFTLEADHFFVRKGVLLYSYTLIPYENMQDVHVSQSLFDVPFGTWSVSVFTATASARGAEMIPVLGKADANRLRDAIFEKIRRAKHVTD